MVGVNDLTTTLRCIAGWERPESGEIELAGVPAFAGTGMPSGHT